MNREKALYEELYKSIEAMDERVACQDAPDAFFIDEVDPNRTYKTQLAKKLCGSCPVQLLCLEYALEARERHGIWGGTLPKERDRIVRNGRLSA
jgi:hypothetical protein